MMVEFSDPYVGTVRISEQCVADLYMMACDFTRQRGNTFHFLKRQIEERYPELKGCD